jgi:uncharacterized cupin superfamily protein
MHRPIINISEVELQPRPAAFQPTGSAVERYDARTAFISRQLGAQKLGYNLTAVPPGKRAFPFHNHHVNEEMFFVLDGEGEVRIGEARFAIRSGDIIACPPGGKEVAHQIINTGSVELKYIAVSTKQSPELCEYPDSQKFGILAELSTGAASPPRMFRYVGREEQNVDYWEGE